MNKYELEQALKLLGICRDLLVGHIPAIYTNKASIEVIAAIKQVEKDIKNLDK